MHVEYKLILPLFCFLSIRISLVGEKNTVSCVKCLDIFAGVGIKCARTELFYWLNSFPFKVAGSTNLTVVGNWEMNGINTLIFLISIILVWKGALSSRFHAEYFNFESIQFEFGQLILCFLVDLARVSHQHALNDSMNDYNTNLMQNLEILDSNVTENLFNATIFLSITLKLIYFSTCLLFSFVIQLDACHQSYTAMAYIPLSFIALFIRIIYDF